MLLDYLERLRREPKSVRITATYIISLSFTAVIAFLWLIARSVAPPVASTAATPKGVDAIRERFETLVPDEAQKEEPAPRQSIEEILRGRARGTAQQAPREIPPPVLTPPSIHDEKEPIVPAQTGGELVVPHSTATLETEGASW